MPVKYFEGLNDRQKEAAAHTEGPLLIIAGAGAGKTKTITHRIAHLIETGIPARQILAVTFTNKAAGEMRDRIRNLVPEGKGMPMVSTFHSLGVRLLREFHEEAGLAKGFTIWDRDDSNRAVKAALDRMSVEQWPPRSILSSISRQKGDGVAQREFAGKTHSYRDQVVAQVWEQYEKALRDEGALDFDDLLFRTLSLLRDSERVQTLLQNRWPHITIDEYQDTNKAQYEIARRLAGEKRNICVVGDIDQNIYSWRGADIAHLMEFEFTFPGAKVVTLEQNYRSTRTILSAANAVIEKNKNRKPKILYTDNGIGEPITLYGAKNEVDEAWFIAQQAALLIEQGKRPSEIAILYRENFMSRTLEEAMIRHGVPYRVLGTRFFERKEVKDMLSYLRAAMNPQSKIDLMRIVAVPPRGIGKVTLEKMLEGKDAELTGATGAKVAAFRGLITKISHAINTLPTSEAVRFTLEITGMESMFGKTEEGRERLANVQELVNFATKFDYELPVEGMEKMLEEAALQSDQDELQEKLEQVSLMTIHASKGLEFDVVFVTGLEQGLFPAIRQNDAGRDEEEERRLFYVALTRARERLYLTYASERMKYGSREYAIPSEFIDDIDARLLKTMQRKRSLLDDDDIIR
ncbi:MAG: UvrD-helicase domain-containing protein [Candidatus Pacebacteria bacterium]|nr:UvrD-helicase domain-containing protein [Candidatus Paceibacterota bacterium]